MLSISVTRSCMLDSTWPLLYSIISILSSKSLIPDIRAAMPWDPLLLGLVGEFGTLAAEVMVGCITGY